MKKVITICISFFLALLLCSCVYNTDEMHDAYDRGYQSGYDDGVEIGKAKGADYVFDELQYSDCIEELSILRDYLDGEDIDLGRALEAIEFIERHLDCAKSANNYY